MDSFTLLYLFYIAKLGFQSSTWYICQAHSTSPSIPYIAAAVTTLAVIPLFHVIVHISMSKPLSSTFIVAYFCFNIILAFLWYEPIRESHSILLFALVTCCDLTALLIFVLPKAVKWSISDKGERKQDRGRLLTLETGRVPSVHTRVDFFAPSAPPRSEYLHPDISHGRPRGQDPERARGSFDNFNEQAVSGSTSPTSILSDVDSVTIPSPQAIGLGPRTIPQLDIELAPGEVGNYDIRSVEEMRFADKQDTAHSQLPAEHVAEMYPYFYHPEGVRDLDTVHLPSLDVQTPRRPDTPFEPVQPRAVRSQMRGNVI
ncbi:hypothetical protein BKA65DRAFT_125916 [Rhexocercosporidium sp. MPI-PUGE-AT-0058]|nr:hypothetical protein BKA65DRAFT_125916 [Rhexocercosporidium sp. MPI-PUGE-AT-0058]